MPNAVRRHLHGSHNLFDIHHLARLISAIRLFSFADSASQSQRGFNSRANLAMLLATLVMFASSTASWALGFTVIIKLIENELLVDPDQPLESKYAMVNQSVFGMNISLPYLALVNYLIGDAIVVWRAWVLWRNSPKVMTVPIVLWTCSVGPKSRPKFHDNTEVTFNLSLIIVASVLFGVFQIISISVPTHRMGIMTGYSQLASWAFELATNIVATSLIGYKTWTYRRFIRQNIIGKNRKTSIQKILAILVESGILYCFVWIALIVCGTVPISGVRAVDAGASADLFLSVSSHIAGIYPTIIVVLVSMQNTVWDVSGFTSDVLSKPQFIAPETDILPKTTGHESISRPTLSTKTSASTQIGDADWLELKADARQIQ
ncbi:hypothetical protein HETIRDRAFT_415863 [Heterobasidion irregulare TC 32-1]|uniref:Uncharacterized protein n=1 Tax=Heterobasidion irregulare (strain TC 32-1) TaxID=747525 RepID=W4KGF8_HETIT|nr:uncharacterized protein HETIRDRAFT_415863 [Heterobasidion irregulare TC 32-1]ETW84156.1 hypothetical protein HETIRDRAFT_415863 [Heterobasidion irregulare TC 32-1]